jgi:hypothetical protein
LPFHFGNRAVGFDPLFALISVRRSSLQQI